MGVLSPPSLSPFPGMKGAQLGLPCPAGQVVLCQGPSGRVMMQGARGRHDDNGLGQRSG